MSKEKMSKETYREIVKPMADDLRKAESWCDLDGVLNRSETMYNLYKMGYRKQSEGENVATYPSSAFECSECHWQDWDSLTADSAYNFCPNCGAKMKGDKE